MNPLQQYRQAQRRAREQFEPFTSTHCATCATPCCRKPTWVRPSDIILVEELGYRLPRRDAAQPAGALLDLLTTGETEDEGAPCDYLQANGCAFPSDLRPFGCAAAICEPMRRMLPANELAAVQRAVAELTRTHEILAAALLAPTPPDGGSR
ncbi:MAG: hypothetical protein ACO1SX_14995 [Actinomycetota bacterium]